MPRRRHAQHRVDRPGQVSAQRLVAQRAPTSAGRRRTPAGRRRAGARAATRPRRTAMTSGAAPRRSPPASGNLEVQLPQPVSQPDLAQRQAAGQRAERRVVHRHQRGRQLGRRRRRPATTPSARRTCASSSAARSAANGSAVSSTACTSEPNVAPAGSSAIGDGTSRPGCAARQRNVAGLVVQRDDLGLAADPAASRRPGSAPSTRCAATWCRSPVEVPAAEVRSAPAWPAGTAGAAVSTDSSSTGPPAASHSRSRASASSSLIFAGTHTVGHAPTRRAGGRAAAGTGRRWARRWPAPTTPPPGPAPASSRRRSAGCRRRRPRRGPASRPARSRGCPCRRRAGSEPSSSWNSTMSRFRHVAVERERQVHDG